MNYNDVRRTVGMQGHMDDAVSRIVDKLIDAGCDAESLIDAINSRDQERELRALKDMYYI